MTGETRSLALVLERIVRNAMAQFRDISDADLNRPLELPESNTALALATHLIGAAEYWVLQLAGGQDVQRERSAEFRATGTGAELVARYERWLTAMRQLFQTLPEDRLEQPARKFNGEPITVRDALLHTVEHAALHQGHLELTRQLLGYPPAGEQ